MFLITTIAEWFANGHIAAGIDLFAHRATKIRLQKVKQNRQDRPRIHEDSCYDNSLLGRIEILYSIERAKQAEIIAWRYWAQGRESAFQRSGFSEPCSMYSGSTLFWSVMRPEQESSCRPAVRRPVIEFELEASFIAGSQKNKAVGDYLLRNQPEQSPWGLTDNLYGMDELIPLSRRLEMK